MSHPIEALVHSPVCDIIQADVPRFGGVDVGAVEPHEAEEGRRVLHRVSHDPASGVRRSFRDIVLEEAGPDLHTHPVVVDQAPSQRGEDGGFDRVKGHAGVDPRGTTSGANNECQVG